MEKFNLVTKAYAVFLLWTAAAIALAAQTFTILHNFDGTDGANPYAGLVQGADGNFYGTTYEGACCGDAFNGTVFKITAGGTLATLYDFCSSNCPNGANPWGNLIQGTDGNFFGTTYAGGYGGNCDSIGCGTIFKMTPDGTLKTLYTFCSQYGCAAGSNPGTGLVQGADGDFYGTTASYGPRGSGTVFRITSSGSLTTIHGFDRTDGASPNGPLVQSTDGNFYGTTAYGGANGCGGYGRCGTVFSIAPHGKFMSLYSFCAGGYPACPDGFLPAAGLVQGTDGNFYGTTEFGGTYGWGTIFKITSGGTLITLYSFCAPSNCTDGYFPQSGLIQATDGNFYGTTEGTIFQITPSGMLTTLYTFEMLNLARAGLVQGTERDLLWNDLQRRPQQRWHGLQPVSRSRAIRGNKSRSCQSGKESRDSGDQS